MHDHNIVYYLCAVRKYARFGVNCSPGLLTSMCEFDIQTERTKKSLRFYNKQLKIFVF